MFQIPSFLLRYISSVFHCVGNIHGRVPVDYLWFVSNYSALDARTRSEGQVRVGGKNISAVVHAKLLWRAMYCVKTRIDPEYQYISWYQRLLVRRAPRII